jgi:hypothetical protein
MATFTTRIELYGAGEQDYRSLQAEMSKEFFTALKNLPSSKMNPFNWKAEFKREGNLSLHEVNAAIFRAVQKIGKKFSFSTIRNRAK